MVNDTLSSDIKLHQQGKLSPVIDMTFPEQRQSFRTRLRSQAYLVTMFLRSTAAGLLVAQSQYVYRKVASSYTNMATLANATSSDTCGSTNINTSSEEYKLHSKISEESSRWTMYMSLCAGIPNILVILLLGSYSDQVGRRFLFLLSLTGSAVKGILATLVIYFDLHLGFFLIGEVVEAITGGYPSLGIAAFSYTSDQHVPDEVNGEGGFTNKAFYTKPSGNADDRDARVSERSDENKTRKAKVQNGKKDVSDQKQDNTPSSSSEHEAEVAYDSNRAVRILAIECFNTGSAGIIQLSSGYFIAYAGFFYVILTSTIIVIIAFVYTWVVIENAESQRKRGRKSVLEPFRIIQKAFRQRKKLSTFILCNLAIMLVVFGDGGLIRTMPIYQMSPPFCWSSVQIGWFNSEFYFVTILAVPFLMGMKRFGLSEPTMAGIGTTINAVGTSIYALANVYSWVFYMVAVLTVPGMLAFALTRTITSRLAGPEAHGAMFAFTALVEQVMWMVGTVTGSGVYQVTVAKLHSAVFFYFAAIYLTAASVYYATACIERRRSSQTQDIELNVDKIAEDEGNKPAEHC